MPELERIREAMTAYLKKEGVDALTAWPDQDRGELAGPVAAVSLRSCQGGPGGFQDYLGERYDPERGAWQELYGKRIRAVFGLDLYAPRTGGAQGLQAAFDTLSGALSAGGPEGLRVKEWSRGESGYDQALGLFHCRAEAVCDAYLYAVAEEGGTFLDFIVKGEANGIDDT